LAGPGARARGRCAHPAEPRQGRAAGRPAGADAEQLRMLLAMPDRATIRGRRDRAMLEVLGRGRSTALGAVRAAMGRRRRSATLARFASRPAIHTRTARREVPLEAAQRSLLALALGFVARKVGLAGRLVADARDSDGAVIDGESRRGGNDRRVLGGAGCPEARVTACVCVPTSGARDRRGVRDGGARLARVPRLGGAPGRAGGDGGDARVPGGALNR
jgi:hypothetical protein